MKIDQIWLSLSFLKGVLILLHCSSESVSFIGSQLSTGKNEKEYSQAGDTRIPLPRESLWTPQEIVDCKVGLCTSLRTVAEFL